MKEFCLHCNEVTFFLKNENNNLECQKCSTLYNDMYIKVTVTCKKCKYNCQCTFSIDITTDIPADVLEYIDFLPCLFNNPPPNYKIK